ncbi:DUF2917 domain-containing protein [Sphaerotilus natans]|uniref:DUF2917 domain-containing protein n=1 Tax=Sphaerotilus natans TaxID=34103 RepID=UPI00406C4490
MDSDLCPSSSPRRVLPRGHVTCLSRPHDGILRIAVENGRLWLTQEGDPDDHFIAAGEDIALCGPGTVVIESDGAADAVFSVSFGPAPVSEPVPAQASAASVSATAGVSDAAPARPLLAGVGG